MTRLTVPERSHCRRMMRAASTVASVVFLYWSYVRLEQPQPLRRAGERPQQPGLLVVLEVRQGGVDDAASA